MKLNIEQKQTLWAEGGKFCLDIAKLIFGGIILASIMKKDIDPVVLLCIGGLLNLALAALGFLLLLISKNKLKKGK